MQIDNDGFVNGSVAMHAEDGVDVVPAGPAVPPTPPMAQILPPSATAPRSLTPGVGTGDNVDHEFVKGSKHSMPTCSDDIGPPLLHWNSMSFKT